MFLVGLKPPTDHEEDTSFSPYINEDDMHKVHFCRFTRELLHQFDDAFFSSRATYSENPSCTFIQGRHVVAFCNVTDMLWSRWMTQLFLAFQTLLKLCQNAIIQRAQNTWHCRVQHTQFDIYSVFLGCGSQIIYHRSYFWRHILTISMWFFWFLSSPECDKLALGSRTKTECPWCMRWHMNAL